MMCKNCKSPDVGILEYGPNHPGHWDGWSEFYCPKCKTRVGRFSARTMTNALDYEDPKLRFK